jgi:hypothetical protein
MLTTESKVKSSLSATPLCDMDYVASELDMTTKVKFRKYTRYFYSFIIVCIDSKSTIFCGTISMYIIIIKGLLCTKDQR